MKRLLQKEKAREVLNLPYERKELFEEIKRYARDGYITRYDLRSALARLRYSKSDHLDKKEVRRLREILGEKKALTKRDLERAEKLLKKNGVAVRIVDEEKKEETRRRHQETQGRASRFSGLAFLERLSQEKEKKRYEGALSFLHSKEGEVSQGEGKKMTQGHKAPPSPSSPFAASSRFFREKWEKKGYRIKGMLQKGKGLSQDYSSVSRSKTTFRPLFHHRLESLHGRRRYF